MCYLHGLGFWRDNVAERHAVIRLLKNSAQRANLRLNRSLAEEKRGTDWDIAAVTCPLKPHFACPTGFSTACYSV